METYHSLTPQSQNAKLGMGVAAHLSSNLTCPASCPLKDKECYARFSYTGMQWARLSSGKGMSWDQFVDKVECLPKKWSLRLNVAGDLVPTKPNGEIIDQKALRKLFVVAKKRNLNCWGYSHKTLTPGNVKILKEAAKNNVVINASCDDLDEADKAYSKGLPVVVTVHSDFKSGTLTKAGNKVIVCPQQTHNKTCAECMLCAKGNRSCFVAFRSHGTSKKSLDARLKSA